MNCGMTFGGRYAAVQKLIRARLGNGVALAVLAASLSSVAVLPAPAWAQQASAVSYAVPSGPLATALTTFADQSGLQILYPSQIVSGLNAGGVSGSYTAEQALSLLLAGTPLTYRFADANTVVLANPASAPMGEDGSIVLGEVNVSAYGGDAASGAGFMGTPDWVYARPASTSVISGDAISNAPVRNTRDLLDGVAGVYANRSEGQNPGIAVNIRGLQDQNRVISMIDGARQNFQRNGHASAERTYVDTAFIRQIEVEKAGTSGVGGAGSLGGSVNFRTVSADDLIVEGRNWGLELTGGLGTNAYNFDSAGIGAVRLADNVAVVAGFSRKSVGAYDIGKNGEVEMYSSSYQDGALVSTGQEVLSTLLKVEAQLTDDLDLTLGWVRNQSKFSHGSYNLSGDLVENLQDVVNNTFTSHLHWDPVSDLVDLNLRVWYNHVQNNELRAATINNPVLYPVNYGIGTTGVSLDNTSRFDTGFGALSFNYGVEAFWDSAKTEAPQAYYFEGNDFTASYTGMNPSGNRDVYSAFANATLEHDDWLTVSGGLRYDYYRLHGSTSVFTRQRSWQSTIVCTWYYADGTCRRQSEVGQWVNTFPETVIDIDRSDSALLPTAMIAVQPFDWLQPFVKYSRTMRPPTVMEAFMSGGHPSANITDYAPNPGLLAETGDTFEVGANISHDGVFAADDSVRLKAVAFHRAVDNYISLGEIHLDATDSAFGAFVNVDGITTMKGIELEASYDARQWYAGLSYTYLETDFADTYTYNGASHQVEPSVIFTPPQHKLTLDAGVRLMEEKLTLGGRINYVGGTTPGTGVLVTNYVTKDYTTVDVYGSYAFNENTTLRAAISNLTDLAYVPALGASGLPAPGRTATLSLNIKF